jgi:hypothetical protein
MTSLGLYFDHQEDAAGPLVNAGQRTRRAAAIGANAPTVSSLNHGLHQPRTD